MENKMNEVAKILGVYLEESFDIEGCINPYHLSEKGLINGNGMENGHILQLILANGLDIIRKPFKPKRGETYYYVGGDRIIDSSGWSNHIMDYYLFNAGNCFRTEEEITDEIKERIVKEMKGKYKS